LPASASLIDRCLTVGLKVPEARQSPKHLFDRVDQLRPALLGALCTAVGTALARLDDVPALQSTRFVDAAHWAAAASPALGLTSQDIAGAFRADAHPVAGAILKCLENTAGKEEWEGSATELLSALRQAAPDYTWPRSPRALSQLLRGTPLHGVGIDYSRTTPNRKIHLWKINDANCVFRPLNPFQSSTFET